MLDSTVTQMSTVNIFNMHDQVETKFQTSSSVFSKKCVTSQGLVYLSLSLGNFIYTLGADLPSKLLSDSDSV